MTDRGLVRGDSAESGSRVVDTPRSEPPESSRSYQRDTTIAWSQGELLGEGSFSKVYLGLNKATGELIAVKELRGQLQRDALEAEIRVCTAPAV